MRRRPLTEAIGSRITGVELGAMLGFLGSKVLGQFDPFHEQPGEQGRLLLVAPNIVHVERELARRPARLPAVGVPARGDPPGAVHRGAVDDRPPPLGDGLRSSARCRPTRPSCSATRSARSATWSPASPTAACSTCSPTPEQKAVIERVTGVMSLLEGHADVVMDGVGPEVIPTRRGDPPQVHPAAQGRRRARPAAAAAARARPEDGAVPRRRRSSCAPRSTRSAWRASTPCGPSRPTCPPRARSSTRRCGSPASTAEPVRVARSLGGRGPARRTTHARLTSTPGDTVLVACSGGADSLALLAATVFEARTDGAWRVIGVTVDHGLQEGRPSTPTGWSRRCGRWVSTRRRRSG